MPLHTPACVLLLLLHQHQPHLLPLLPLHQPRPLLLPLLPLLPASQLQRGCQTLLLHQPYTPLLPLLLLLLHVLLAPSNRAGVSGHAATASMDAKLSMAGCCLCLPLLQLLVLLLAVVLRWRGAY
jgi:hypothetical protein